MATGLVDIMKRAAMDAMDNSKPCDLRYGTVTSVSPLNVKISQQLTLPESVLIVPEKLTDYTVYVSFDWNTENHSHTHDINDTYSGGGSASENTHKHQIVSEKSKKIKIHNALKVGDKVVLVRQAGGQSYFILDRI